MRTAGNSMSKPASRTIQPPSLTEAKRLLPFCYVSTREGKDEDEDHNDDDEEEEEEEDRKREKKPSRH